MRIEPSMLFRILLLCFGLGTALGTGNDLLHFLSSVVGNIGEKLKKCKDKTQAILQCIQDFLFCLAAGFVITVILFYYNDGRPRGFVIFALLLGYLTYRYTLGRLFRRISPRLSAMLGKSIYTVFWYVLKPLLRAGTWCVKTAMKPIRTLLGKLSERRIQKYHAIRIKQLRKISKEGFVNI